MQWLLLISLVLVGVVMMYSVVVLLATLSFWVVNVNNLTELFFGFLEMGRYPASAFPEPMRIVISFVVPIAFITTIPAQALLGRIDVAIAAYGLAFSVVAFIASTMFWNHAVRHYSSA